MANLELRALKEVDPFGQSIEPLNPKMNLDLMQFNAKMQLAYDELAQKDLANQRNNLVDLMRTQAVLAARASGSGKGGKDGKGEMPEWMNESVMTMLRDNPFVSNKQSKQGQHDDWEQYVNDNVSLIVSHYPNADAKEIRKLLTNLNAGKVPEVPTAGFIRDISDAVVNAVSSIPETLGYVVRAGEDMIRYPLRKTGIVEEGNYNKWTQNPISSALFAVSDTIDHALLSNEALDRDLYRADLAAQYLDEHPDASNLDIALNEVGNWADTFALSDVGDVLGMLAGVGAGGKMLGSGLKLTGRAAKKVAPKQAAKAKQLNDALIKYADSKGKYFGNLARTLESPTAISGVLMGQEDVLMSAEEALNSTDPTVLMNFLDRDNPDGTNNLEMLINKGNSKGWFSPELMAETRVRMPSYNTSAEKLITRMGTNREEFEKAVKDVLWARSAEVNSLIEKEFSGAKGRILISRNLTQQEKNELAQMVRSATPEQRKELELHALYKAAATELIRRDYADREAQAHIIVSKTSHDDIQNMGNILASLGVSSMGVFAGMLPAMTKTARLKQSFLNPLQTNITGDAIEAAAKAEARSAISKWGRTIGSIAFDSSMEGVQEASEQLLANYMARNLGSDVPVMSGTALSFVIGSMGGFVPAAGSVRYGNGVVRNIASLEPTYKGFQTTFQNNGNISSISKADFERAFGITDSDLQAAGFGKAFIDYLTANGADPAVLSQVASKGVGKVEVTPQNLEAFLNPQPSTLQQSLTAVQNAQTAYERALESSNQLATAKQNVVTLQANVQKAEQDLQAAQVQLQEMGKTYEPNSADPDVQAVEARVQQLESLQKQLSLEEDNLKNLQSQEKQIQSSLAQAKLNLQQAKISLDSAFTAQPQGTTQEQSGKQPQGQAQTQSGEQTQEQTVAPIPAQDSGEQGESVLDDPNNTLSVKDKDTALTFINNTMGSSNAIAPAYINGKMKAIINPAASVGELEAFKARIDGLLSSDAEKSYQNRFNALGQKVRNAAEDAEYKALDNTITALDDTRTAINKILEQYTQASRVALRTAVDSKLEGKLSATEVEEDYQRAIDNSVNLIAQQINPTLFGELSAAETSKLSSAKSEMRRALQQEVLNKIAENIRTYAPDISYEPYPMYKAKTKGAMDASFKYLLGLPSLKKAKAKFMNRDEQNFLIGEFAKLPIQERETLLRIRNQALEEKGIDTNSKGEQDFATELHNGMANNVSNAAVNETVHTFASVFADAPSDVVAENTPKNRTEAKAEKLKKKSPDGELTDSQNEQLAFDFDYNVTTENPVTAETVENVVTSPIVSETENPSAVVENADGSLSVNKPQIQTVTDLKVATATEQIATNVSDMAETQGDLKFSLEGNITPEQGKIFVPAIETSEYDKVNNLLGYTQYNSFKVLSNPTKEQMNFVKDSVVTDKTGKPIVVYHNTGKDFNVFDITRSNSGNSGVGIYVTPHADKAAEYGENQLTLIASVKNPITENTKVSERDIALIVDALYSRLHKGSILGKTVTGADKILAPYNNPSMAWLTGLTHSELEKYYSKKEFLSGTRYYDDVRVDGKSLEYDIVRERAKQLAKYYGENGSKSFLDFFIEISNAFARVDYPKMLEVVGLVGGFDGVINSSEITVFSPNQLKKADNANPSAGSDDLRFSLSEQNEVIAQANVDLASVIGEKAAENVTMTPRYIAEKYYPQLQGKAVNAFFDPKTKKIVIISEAARTPMELATHAWHELAHRGIDIQGRAEWDGMLDDMFANNTMVRQRAQEIQARYDAQNVKLSDRNATEEAVANLYSEYKTGAYKGNSALANFFQKIKQFFANLFGKKTLTDREVMIAIAGLDSVAGYDFKPSGEVLSGYSTTRKNLNNLHTMLSGVLGSDGNVTPAYKDAMFGLKQNIGANLGLNPQSISDQRALDALKVSAKNVKDNDYADDFADVQRIANENILNGAKQLAFSIGSAPNAVQRRGLFAQILSAIRANPSLAPELAKNIGTATWNAIKAQGVSQTYTQPKTSYQQAIGVLSQSADVPVKYQGQIGSRATTYSGLVADKVAYLFTNQARPFERWVTNVVDVAVATGRVSFEYANRLQESLVRALHTVAPRADHIQQVALTEYGGKEFGVAAANLITQGRTKGMMEENTKSVIGTYLTAIGSIYENEHIITRNTREKERLRWAISQLWSTQQDKLTKKYKDQWKFISSITPTTNQQNTQAEAALYSLLTQYAEMTKWNDSVTALENLNDVVSTLERRLKSFTEAFEHPDPDFKEARQLAAGLNRAAANDLIKQVEAMFDTGNGKINHNLQTLRNSARRLSGYNIAIEIEYETLTPEQAADFLDLEGQERANYIAQAERLVQASKNADADARQSMIDLHTARKEVARLSESDYVPMYKADENSANQQRYYRRTLTADKYTRADGSVVDSAIPDGFQNVLYKTRQVSRSVGRQYFFDELEKFEKEICQYVVNDNGENNSGIVHTFGERSSTGVSRYRQGVYQNFEFADKAVTDALNSQNIEPPSSVLDILAKPTRLMSAMWVNNPMFQAKQIFRDTPERASTLVGKTIYDKNGKLLDSVKLMNTVLLRLGNPIEKARYMKVAGAFTSKWQGVKGLTPEEIRLYNYLEELERLGGFSGRYKDLLQFNRQDIVKMANRYGRNRFTNAAAQTLYLMNTTTEMFATLNVYSVLRENGVSKEEAAAVVLDTANFRKRGAVTRTLQAFYPFAQSAFMGGGNMLNVLFALSSTTGKAKLAQKGKLPALNVLNYNGWRQIGKFALLFYLWNLAASSMLGAFSVEDGDDDDNEISRWGLLSENIKSANLVLPTGDGNTANIPVAYGIYRIALAMANGAVEYGLDRTDGFGVAKRIIEDGIVKNAQPISPSSVSIWDNPTTALLQTFAPAVVQPVVNVATNTNSFGNRILSPYALKEDEFNHLQRTRGVNDGWVEAATLLYKGTGLDLHPKQVRELVNGWVGGLLGDLVSDAVEFGMATDKPAGKIPVLHNFNPVRENNYTMYADMELKNNITHIEKFIKAVKAKGEDYEPTEEEQEVLDFFESYKSAAGKFGSDIRKARKEFANDPDGFEEAIQDIQETRNQYNLAQYLELLRLQNKYGLY